MSWPVQSSESNLFRFFICGCLNDLAYATDVENEEMFHQPILEVGTTIPKYSVFFERVLLSMIQRVLYMH